MLFFMALVIFLYYACTSIYLFDNICSVVRGRIKDIVSATTFVLRMIGKYGTVIEYIAR